MEWQKVRGCLHQAVADWCVGLSAMSQKSQPGARGEWPWVGTAVSMAKSMVMLVANQASGDLEGWLRALVTA